MKLLDLSIMYAIDEAVIVVINVGFAESIVCWFGVIATKYANITSIPAT